MLYTTAEPVGEILPYGDPPKLVPKGATRDTLRASVRRMARIGGEGVPLGAGDDERRQIVAGGGLKASTRTRRRIG